MGLNIFAAQNHPRLFDLTVLWVIVGIQGLLVGLSFGQYFRIAAVVNLLRFFLSLAMFSLMMHQPLMRYPLDDFSWSFLAWESAGLLFFTLVNISPSDVSLSSVFLGAFWLGFDLVLVDSASGKYWKNEGWDTANWLIGFHAIVVGWNQIALFTAAAAAQKKDNDMKAKEYKDFQDKLEELSMKLLGKKPTNMIRFAGHNIVVPERGEQPTILSKFNELFGGGETESAKSKED